MPRKVKKALGGPIKLAMGGALSSAIRNAMARARPQPDTNVHIPFMQQRRGAPVTDTLRQSDRRLTDNRSRLTRLTGRMMQHHAEGGRVKKATEGIRSLKTKLEKSISEDGPEEQKRAHAGGGKVKGIQRVLGKPERDDDISDDEVNELSRLFPLAALLKGRKKTPTGSTPPKS
jgi:hypothetical protein